MDIRQGVMMPREHLESRIIILEEQNAELLEALKEIAEAKDIFFDPYNGLYFRDLVIKARRAIAKA